MQIITRDKMTVLLFATYRGADGIFDGGGGACDVDFNFAPLVA